MRSIAARCVNAIPAIAWDECACLLCGSRQHSPLMEAADPHCKLRFLIVQCKLCGLAFTNPRPDFDSISQFYPDDYPCHQKRKANQPGAQATGQDNPVACAPGWLKKEFVPTGQARLLDFGCGSGVFLQRMRLLGWNVTGLDRAEAVVSHVRTQLGLTAHVGTLPNTLWTGPSFEAITMWQALEHVHQPLEVLQAAHRLLTPGGRIVVAVPNFEGFAARWFGPHWFGLDLPRHLTHFTPNTLRSLLNRAGFEHVEIQHERKSGWIRHSAARQHADSPWLRSRLGSGMASWWGRLIGRAESLIAIALK